MQQIDTFLGRHAGEPVWIFGKGPSLDSFQIDHADGARICINESLRAVPEPAYFFAHDEGPIRNVSESWPTGCSAVLQQVRAEFAVDCGISDSCVFVYEKCYRDNGVRDMNASDIAKHRCLFGLSGTVHSAIHFCRLIRASHVTMVGFDGSGGYAKSIGLPDGGAQHDRIRRDSVLLLEAMNMPYEFFHPEPN